MAWRQRHLADLRRVPGGDDEAARIRIVPDRRDDVGDLVDGAAVGGRPGAPLTPVDGTEFAVLVGPFVPDRDTVIVEIFYIGIAGQKPQELVSDRLEVHLLCGEQRKALGEIKPYLVTKDRQRARPGAVALLHPGGEDQFQQVEILAHAGLVT